MNWDIVTAQAKIKATEYADRKCTSEFANNTLWSATYNGFFDGYMADAGERESLRAILKRQEKIVPLYAEKVVVIDYNNSVENSIDLDSLI